MRKGRGDNSHEMSDDDSQNEANSFETKIPARMDRLPWSRWHWVIVGALGITWILDGLEVTLKGSISAVLKQPSTLNLTSGQIGSIASVYLVGAVVGALVFGWLTDRLGRKRLFFVTLGTYFVGAVLTAFSWGFLSFAAFRFVTGLGIGGEYAAINSAIDEMIPAEHRGWVDLGINGSYWVGAAIGASAGIVLLGTGYLPPHLAWRVTFGIGAILGLGVIFMRRYVPESPRWLMTHGKREEAEEVVSDIEQRVEEDTGEELEEPDDEESITIQETDDVSFREIADIAINKFRDRSFVGLSLFVSQAFMYNAIFFTYALVLTEFYGVAPTKTPWYLLPFALGNFLGAVVLGRFFDTVGRKKMISGTYTTAAVLLAAVGFMFWQGMLNPITQTVAWTIIFFFASPAASSAYLTVSETFPLEIRAMAISLFYAVGTLTGGVVAPAVFGRLIGTGSRRLVFYGYAFAAALLVAAAAVEWVFGVEAAQRSLEDVSDPLSSISKSSESADSSESDSAGGTSSSTSTSD